MPHTSTEQAKRFQEAARDLGADESDDALDRVMGKLNLKKRPEPQTDGHRRTKNHDE